MEQPYNNIPDEELIVRLRDGETPIMDYIIEKYKELVKKKTRSMYILGADHEDLLQEGMIGLFKAIRDYDAGRDASFNTFANLCITRQVYTAVQASNRKKHVFLNSYVSLNGSKESPEGEQLELFQALVAPNTNPEDLIIDRENLNNLERSILQELSAYEKQVLDLYLIGLSYTEIAKVLGKTEKATDNAMQRVKMKIKKFLT